MSAHIVVSIIFLLFSRAVVATGGLNGLPVLNGIIPTVSSFLGMKTRIGQFVHPGIWHTHDDLERMRLGVERDEEPYASAFRNFSADMYSAANVSPHPRFSCSRLTCELVYDART